MKKLHIFLIFTAMGLFAYTVINTYTALAGIGRFISDRIVLDE